MSDKTSNNKRIAKNTLILYIRMLFLMVVNLYTSRVILRFLGVEDYGVYNAVAGFIAMFSMVSASMSSAISRFITFVLGQDDKHKLKKVFATSIIIQLFLGAIVITLVEMFGVWFLNTHMTIPEGREIAANWVLQLSLVTFILNLWSTPYNAVIIAHEKMNAFAYIGIFEGLAGLIIALLIKISPFDSLIFYAILIMLVAFVTRMVYAIYCKKNFEECTVIWKFDKSIFLEMFGFAGWNFIGTISGLLRNQGINILFNVYNGPIVNAARGLAVQIDNAILKFSQSFYTAVQPQITKSYAVNNIGESHNLVLWSSRLAFYLLLVLSMPVLAESDYVLNLWLGEAPLHTSTFVQIVVLYSLLESFSQPLIHLMLATGKIKKYQIIVGTINLLNFPVAWFLLHLDYSPEIAQTSVILFSITALIARLQILKTMTCFPVKDFVISTVLKCIILFIMSISFSYLIQMNMEYGFNRFLTNLILSELFIGFLVYYFGLTSGERYIIKTYLKKHI